MEEEFREFQNDCCYSECVFQNEGRFQSRSGWYGEAKIVYPTGARSLVQPLYQLRYRSSHIVSRTYELLYITSGFIHNILYQILIKKKFKYIYSINSRAYYFMLTCPFVSFLIGIQYDMYGLVILDTDVCLLGWLWSRQQRGEASSNIYGQSRQWISTCPS